MRKILLIFSILLLVLSSISKLSAHDLVFCIKEDNSIKIELVKAGQCHNSNKQLKFEEKCTTCKDIILSSSNETFFPTKKLKSKINYLATYEFELLQLLKQEISSFQINYQKLPSYAIHLKSTILLL